MAKRMQLDGQSLAGWILADLEEAELVDLLRVAYELSFRKDEGRFAEVDGRLGVGRVV